VRRGSAAISFKGECPGKNDDIMLVRENDEWKIGIGK
jgi:hypothetical protein